MGPKIFTESEIDENNNNLDQNFFKNEDLHYFISASRVPGDSQSHSYPLPHWVCPEKVKKGQEFVANHFFSVFFAHFISLIFLMCYTPVREVLIKTQKSDSRLKALKRYLSTLLHIKGWYENDLLCEKGPSSQDILKIRKVHSAVAKSLTRNNSKSTSTNSKIPLKVSEFDLQVIQVVQQDLVLENGGKFEIQDEFKPVISQLDMSVTQFCFMGFISMFPAIFGIFDDTEGLQGFVHMWALIGHLLGIDDKYNICLEGNRPKCKQILSKILLPELNSCPGETIILWRSLSRAIVLFIPCISLMATLQFVLVHLCVGKFEKDLKIRQLLSLYDVVCYNLMSLCLLKWMRFACLRKVFNYLLRLAIDCAESWYLNKSHFNFSKMSNNV